MPPVELPGIKSSRPDGMLTFGDIAKGTGLHIKTVKKFASRRRPITKRLRVIRLGHRTVLIRPSEWAAFQTRHEGVGY